MNARFASTPEVIGTIRTITGEEEDYPGDRVVGISVKESSGVPVAEIEIRTFSGKIEFVIIEIELAELVSSLALAAFNADKEK
jgi:hypothetical protein